MKDSVLLISVDALMPRLVFEKDRYGLRLPVISSLFLSGASVAREGVRSVFPTFTYPCHQSMITGTEPKTHGTVNNAVFDPEGTHMGAWHWFVSRKVGNLWGAARKNGYISASAAFPTSVGADGDFIAPEFWWDGSEMDSAFIDSMSRPQGLIFEMEKDIGRFAGGLDLTEAGDRQRFLSAKWIIDNKLQTSRTGKPFFMTAYFASYDESAHVNGVYSKEAFHSLELIDSMIGELVASAEKASGGHLKVCVASDHGSIDNTHNISPNVLFREAGLITADAGGRITGWKIYSQRAGGTAEIRLKDRNDAETKAKAASILNGLLGDPKSGVMQVLTGEEAVARGGFPEADFVIVAQRGYELRDNITGPYCSTNCTQKAQHGYSEDFPDMYASFMLRGEGIEEKNIKGMRLIDVAPTLAAVMGFELPDAEGRSVL